MSDGKLYEGNVIAIDETTLAGWVWSPSEPDQRLTVEIRLGSKLVTTFIAAKYRLDLEDAGKSDGRVAFNENLTHFLQPGKNIVSVTVQGTDFHLGNSPLLISRATSDTFPPYDPFADRHLILRRTKYGLMFLNKNDLGIDKALLEYGEWGVDEVSLFETLIEIGDTVYDVGANIGTSALPLAHLAGTSGNVHCFEPQKYAFLKLCANILVNGISNITPNQVAVSNASDKSVYFPFKDYTRDHISGDEPPQELSNFGNAVGTTTLDNYRLHTGPVTLVKIDVEGHELSVLKGMRNLLTTDRPYVYYENTNQAEFQKSYALLNALGYKLYWHIARIFDANNFNESQNDIYQGGGVSFNILAAPSQKEIPLHGLVAVADVNDFWPVEKFSEGFSRKISLIKENG
jgi:FkbM family methyltransferase